MHFTSLWGWTEKISEEIFSDILNVRILLILMSLFTQILTFQTYPCFWPADEGEHAMEKYGGYSVEMISEQMDGDIFSKRLALTSQEVCLRQ